RWKRPTRSGISASPGMLVRDAEESEGVERVARAGSGRPSVPGRKAAGSVRVGGVGTSGGRSLVRRVGSDGAWSGVMAHLRRGRGRRPTVTAGLVLASVAGARGSMGGALRRVSMLPGPVGGVQGLPLGSGPFPLIARAALAGARGREENHGRE